MQTRTSNLSVRLATGADREALDVGELDGACVAAQSLRDGREIADPFTATSDVAALLRTRASQLIVHRSPRRLRRPRMRLAWSG